MKRDINTEMQKIREDIKDFEFLLKNATTDESRKTYTQLIMTKKNALQKLKSETQEYIDIDEMYEFSDTEKKPTIKCVTSSESSNEYFDIGCRY